MSIFNLTYEQRTLLQSNGLSFEEVHKSYIETALWSSSDNDGNPLNDGFGPEDIAPASTERMVKDCDDFLSQNSDNIQRSGLSQSAIGHNFWLSRNGHGAGFWGAPYTNEEERKALLALSEASKTYGSSDLYVGDDNFLHII